MIQIRYLILSISVFSSIIDYLTRVNINVAIVSMTDHQPIPDLTVLTQSNCFATPEQSSSSNSSTTNHPPHLNSPVYDWTPKTQGIVLGSFFYSYVLMQIPSARAAEVFGPRWIVSLGLLGSAIINVLTPLLTWSVPLLVTSRVLLGIIHSGICPASFALLIKWFPANERNVVFALIDTGENIGAVAASVLTGLLTDRFGWPVAFYTEGCIALAIFTIYVTFIRSSPEQHWLVSKVERDLIHSVDIALDANSSQSTLSVPWIKILTSPPIIASIVARFTLFLSYSILQTKLPVYLNDVLRVPISLNGFFNALLFVASCATLVSGGYLSQYIIKRTCLSRTNTHKLFIVISRVGMATCLAMVPYAGCDQSLVMGLLITAMIFYGLYSAGDTPLPAELSRHFPATLFSIIMMFVCCAGFVAPYLVGLILETPGDMVQHWNCIFYMSAGFCVFGMVVFLLFGSSERLEWDKDLDASS